MRSLMQLAGQASSRVLAEQDLDWLHLLLADWQVLADLAAADLVLWLPTDDGRFIAVAHCRPSTATTVHLDDIIGLYLPAAREANLRQAMETNSIVEPSGTRWAGTYSMTEVCVPISHGGSVIAVVTCESNLASPRPTVGMGAWTQNASRILLEMCARGEYPYTSTPTVLAHGVPRVMDGVILIDGDGTVQELTPNASSCLRRLGIRHSVIGRVLAEDITDVISNDALVEETLAVVVMGRAAWRVEISAHASTVNMCALPLTNGRHRLGAVILTRDVSEMRRREEELMTKDATIREIHHRVKNNLQTVSALLRLQARRSDSQEVKDALKEAERRVQSIATVHQALSHTVDEEVDFDEVARSVLRLSGAVASTDHSVEVITTGKFGVISADQAQALATVLNELVANSVEHGLAGRDGVIRIDAQRDHDNDKRMTVRVIDNGVGFEPGTPLSGLGTQIVRQMVRGELGGTIEWEPGEESGTVVTLRLRVE